MLRFLIKLYLLLVLAFAVALLSVPRLVNFAFQGYWEDFARARVTGSAYVIEQVILEVPQEQWEKRAEEINQHFGAIKIAVAPLARLGLTRSETTLLHRGEIVARLDEDEYFHQIAGSDYVLHLFVPGVPVTVQLVNLLTYFLITTVVLGVLMIWAWPHWRDLQRLKEAAEQIGRGDLGARAKVAPGSSIANLVYRFNGMARRIQHLLSSQQEMINAVSHELRTPISRLRFGVELLKSAKAPEQVADRLDGLNTDLQELDQLVTELLSYSRLEQVGKAPETETVSLAELVDSVVGSLTFDLEARGIDCQVRIAGASDRVLVDPRIIARAIVNLLGNAMRYCRKQILIQVETSVNGAWTLCVDDDGIGVPPEERDRIFEPFYRLDRSRDRATGGFGLGLAIVQRAAESHHGRVYVDEAPLGGARFALEIPAPVPTQHAKQPRGAQ